MGETISIEFKIDYLDVIKHTLPQNLGYANSNEPKFVPLRLFDPVVLVSFLNFRI